MREREPNLFQSPDTGRDLGGSPEPFKPEEIPASQEYELSLEEIEKVMEKVEDIDTKGIAYTSVDSIEGMVNLTGILKHGLLGQTIENRDQSPTPDSWTEDVKRGTSFVHFNIVGRSHDVSSFRGERAGQDKGWHVYPGRVLVLFDASNMEELVPRHWMDIKKQKNGTFRASISPTDELNELDETMPIKEPQVLQALKKSSPLSPFFDEDGMPCPNTEVGFIFSGRIAPRRFQGIVFYPKVPGGNYFIEKTNSRAIHDQAMSLAALQVEINKEKPERLLPIYDIGGNLHWPKQMSYEEVKKYVAEREAKKSKPDQEE